MVGRVPPALEVQSHMHSSANTTATESSHTHSETRVQNVNVTPSSRVSMISTPQPVPVRINNRNDLREALNTLNSHNPIIINSNNASVSPWKNSIGDLIINNVNLRVFKPNTKKHSKRGARVRGILNEISMYDMRAFSEVIIYVGGNDVASQVDERLKDDELTGKIKQANKNCKSYLCKMAPLGDTDVANINKSIDRLAEQWRNQEVPVIQKSQ